MLQEILTQDPKNVLARYGLAMEFANSGQTDRALEEFGKLLATNPDYPAAYFMSAQTLAKANRVDEAKKMLVDGIAAAQRPDRRGNRHGSAPGGNARRGQRLRLTFRGDAISRGNWFPR